jgi:FtsZ-interacting cell division protein ZipA
VRHIILCNSRKKKKKFFMKIQKLNKDKKTLEKEEKSMAYEELKGRHTAHHDSHSQRKKRAMMTRMTPRKKQTKRPTHRPNPHDTEGKWGCCVAASHA